MKHKGFGSSLAQGLLSVVLGLVLVGSSAQAALAGEVQMDNLEMITVDQPYAVTQSIPDVYQSLGVYGKLAGEVPIDIYRFTPSQDGEQTVYMLTRGSESVSDQSSPVLVLVDPTGKNAGQSANIPVPDDTYASYLLKAPAEAQVYNEPGLIEQYKVVAEQRLTLVKNTTYYLVVLDPSRTTTTYVLKFGDAKLWGAVDIFKHFSTWWSLKLDLNGGVTPYQFGTAQAGLLVFFLGLVILLGMWLVQSSFIMGGMYSKLSAYIAVKLQAVSRVVLWVSLWFTLVGGYLYFSRGEWVGIPFVIALSFIPVLVLTLIDSVVLAPKLMKVEVAHKEASIPLSLKKAYYVTFILNLISVLGFLTAVVLNFAK